MQSKCFLVTDSEPPSHDFPTASFPYKGNRGEWGMNPSETYGLVAGLRRWAYRTKSCITSAAQDGLRCPRWPHTVPCFTCLLKIQDSRWGSHGSEPVVSQKTWWKGWHLSTDRKACEALGVMGEEWWRSDGRGHEGCGNLRVGKRQIREGRDWRKGWPK